MIEDEDDDDDEDEDEIESNGDGRWIARNWVSVLPTHWQRG